MKNIKLIIQDIKKYYPYSIYAAKATLKAEVATSFLNWLWWILDPLLFMMVYSFVSIIVFGRSEKYFAAFVFIGLTSWNFFNKTVLNSVKLVKNNAAIVSKVYVPKYILILVVLMVNGFKMMISFALVAGMIALYHVKFSLNMLYFIPTLLVLIVVTFGMSTFALHWGVFVEDLYNILNVLFKLTFYLSGIFYSIEKRLSGFYGELLLKLNPAAFLINEFRRVLLYHELPHRKLLLGWLLVGIAMSYLGVRTIYKNENRYIKVI